MNLSKKAAYELGKTLATTLHMSGGTNHVIRGAVLFARDDILDTIEKSDTRIELRCGFDETLDKLEPLTLGPRSWSRNANTQI